jgi:acyl-coenzyme A synthetase/AMP-(fatty) acid ligase
MGHRIELGEIDTVLSAVKGIERVCCCYHHQKSKIVAFVCGNIEKASILDSVRDILPAYMIPNVFVQVDNMPMNKNGKIDRVALMELFENKRKEK